jgi:hypothetical protein
LQSYVHNISTFNALFPQEKVYLHLDNTGYFSGETLWYKAYVIRTDTGRYTDLSSVLYVELVDPFGEIIETQKLKIENGQCHGDISLTAAHVDGFYELRAYTRYNTNWNSAGIYSRVLPVFKKPSTDGDYSQMHIRRDFRKYRQGDDIPDSLTLKELRHWNRGPSSPTVTFYPEGGHLVRGLMNKVAFEVSYPDSVSVDMRGELRTSSGESLSSVSTLREGRGTFLCVPDTQSLSPLPPRGKVLYLSPPRRHSRRLRAGGRCRLFLVADGHGDVHPLSLWSDVGPHRDAQRQHPLLRHAYDGRHSVGTAL